MDDATTASGITDRRYARAGAQAQGGRQVGKECMYCFVLSCLSFTLVVDQVRIVPFLRCVVPFWPAITHACLL